MNQVMITLTAPVSTDKIEPWVKEQLDRLRDEATASSIRLGPLAPACLPHGADWLLGVDRADQRVRLEDDAALNLVMTDLALLGLRPQLLVASGRARSEISCFAQSPPVLAPPNNR